MGVSFCGGRKNGITRYLTLNALLIPSSIKLRRLVIGHGPALLIHDDDVLSLYFVPLITDVI